MSKDFREASPGDGLVFIYKAIRVKWKGKHLHR